MLAAFELRNAGYKVQVLEYKGRASGRNWTLPGGDRYTELGGFTQECGFDPGLYIPGPGGSPTIIMAPQSIAVGTLRSPRSFCVSCNTHRTTRSSRVRPSAHVGDFVVRV